MATMIQPDRLCLGTVACCAALTLLYHCSALAFVGMWGERPSVLVSTVMRLAIWSIVYGGTVVVLLLLDDYKYRQYLRQQPYLLSIHASIVLWIAWKMLLHTRRSVVEGGAPPSFESLPSNQTIVITGASAGIGLETVKALYRNKNNNKLFLLCRNLSKARAALQNELNDSINDHKRQLVLVECDLCDFASVRRAASEVRKQTNDTNIDILVNNAGVMLKDKCISKDGFEMTLQANYLGHFLLTSLLLPSIPNGRILNVSSSTYQLSKLVTDHHHKKKQQNLDYLLCRDWYSLFGQYSNTKLCNIWHSELLAKRYPNVFTAAIHPGLVRTDVVRNLPLLLQLGNRLFGSVLSTLQKTPKQGAWGTLYCCCTTATTALVHDDNNHVMESGRYWVNRKIQATHAPPPPPNFWQWSVDWVQLTEDECRQLKNNKKSK